MRCRGLLAAIAISAAAWAPNAGAQIVDFGKYPDLKGQWVRYGPSGPDLKGPLVRFGPPGFNGTRFDPSKPPGRGQEPPLTPEYQTIFEANLKDQAAGGQGTTPTFTCLSPGMPRATNGYGEYEFVVTRDTTYILVQHIDDDRRIFTDGRDWPAALEPTFMGYSIGKWVDTQGSGRFDLLEVETRGPFKGPRTFDSGGAPLHQDNQTVVKERIYLDKTDRNVLHDEMTVVDHALTRPWTVLKTYVRDPSAHPVWISWDCEEGNSHLRIGNEDYMVSGDGLLMPAKKGQQPPDLRYFKSGAK